MSKYVVASSAGYCFGVERSMRMAREALEQGECWCLGELIHNRDAVAALEKSGLHVIDTPEELPEEKRIVIRSHGVNKSTYDRLHSRKGEIIDATCPRVLRIHRIAEKDPGKPERNSGSCGRHEPREKETRGRRCFLQKN